MRIGRVRREHQSGRSRRVDRCAGCLGHDAEEQTLRRADHESVIEALQRTHGNAFVARRLAAIARAAAPDKPADPDKLAHKMGVFPGQRPPGYRPEGPVPELAKPVPCGKSEHRGEQRDPEFYPEHIQDSVHYVAHELEIRSGATCDPETGGGFSVRLKDLLAGLRQIPWKVGTVDDVWTDGDRAGFVIGMVRPPSGVPSYIVSVFESCDAVNTTVTGGWLYRKG